MPTMPRFDFVAEAFAGYSEMVDPRAKGSINETVCLNLESEPEASRVLARCIEKQARRKFQNKTKLILNKCAYDPALKEALKHDKSMTLMRLRNFRADLVSMVGEILCTNKSLSRLELIHSPNRQFPGGTFLPLANALRKHNNVLEHLMILSEGLRDAEMVDLASGLHSNTTLRKLVLIAFATQEGRRIGLGPVGIRALSNVLERQRRGSGIRELILSCQHRMGDEGAMALARALRHNTVLEVASLVQCRMGAQGASALMNAVASNSTLQCLHLSFIQDSNVNVLEESSAALSKMLRTNKSLDCLSLSHNHIGEDLIGVLMDALRGNETTKLRRIDLRCCGLSHAAMQRLAVFFRDASLCPLAGVYLLQNENVSEELAAAWLEAVRHNDRIVVCEHAFPPTPELRFYLARNIHCLVDLVRRIDQTAPLLPRAMHKLLSSSDPKVWEFGKDCCFWILQNKPDLFLLNNTQK